MSIMKIYDTIKRPMKGYNCIGQLSNIRFPKVAQPKYDGIRVLFINGVALSASLKPVRNKNIQRIAASHEYDGYDTEYVVPNSPIGLRACSHEVNSFDVSLSGIFHIFDIIGDGDYANRFLNARIKANGLFDVAPSTIVQNVEEIEQYLSEQLKDGYEGAMLKDVFSLYKQGRSSIKSQECLKLKPFVDDDAIVIGYEVEQENQNEPTINELGLTKRSSAKAGKVDKPLIGTLICKSNLFPSPFGVSGFTMELKERMFHERNKLMGKTITYKYQRCEAYKNAPRHPVFVRFIDPII